MELRLALAGCLVLASTLCGKALADNVRRRLKTLTALTEGLQALKIHMTGMFEPVQNAMLRTQCPLMELVAGEMNGGASAAEAWRNVKQAASRRGGVIDALNEGDRSVLENLFSHLGQSGRQEQDALIAGTQSALEELRRQAEEKARQAERLYLSLGLLTGLMLALVVI